MPTRRNATRATASTPRTRSKAVGGLIWGLVSLLVLFWAIGLVAHIGGGLIHFLLVVAIVIAIFNLITGRSASRV